MRIAFGLAHFSLPSAFTFLGAPSLYSLFLSPRGSVEETTALPLFLCSPFSSWPEMESPIEDIETNLPSAEGGGVSMKNLPKSPSLPLATPSRDVAGWLASKPSSLGGS